MEEISDALDGVDGRMRKPLLEGLPPIHGLSIDTKLGRSLLASSLSATTRVDSPPSSWSSASYTSESVCSEPLSATTLSSNDALYTPVEIRAMAEELELAQRAGWFPSSNFLNHTPQITVDDHKRLTELRDAARHEGSAHTAALLVAITRHVRDRDAELAERIERDRVLRHVDSCLRSTKEEERLYQIMKTALSHNTHSVSKQDLSCVEERIPKAVMGLLEKSLHDDVTRISDQVELLRASLDAQIEDLTSQLQSIHAIISRLPETVEQAVKQSLRTPAEQLCHRCRPSGELRQNLADGQFGRHQSRARLLVSSPRQRNRCRRFQVTAISKSQTAVVEVQELREPEAKSLENDGIANLAKAWVGEGAWKRGICRVLKRLRKGFPDSRASDIGRGPFKASS